MSLEIKKQKLLIDKIYRMTPENFKKDFQITHFLHSNNQDHYIISSFAVYNDDFVKCFPIYIEKSLVKLNYSRHFLLNLDGLNTSIFNQLKLIIKNVNSDMFTENENHFQY